MHIIRAIILFQARYTVDEVSVLGCFKPLQGVQDDPLGHGENIKLLLKVLLGVLSRMFRRPPLSILCTGENRHILGKYI